MDLEKELSSMDRITQTQDALDQLILIMSTTINYLSTKAGFKQVNPDIIITQNDPGADSKEVYEQKRIELAQDLVTKAKQLELLIASLPSPPVDTIFVDTYAELERDLAQVYAEYDEVLETAKTLHAQLLNTIDDIVKSKAMASSET